jgi:hypothetical protein
MVSLVEREERAEKGLPSLHTAADRFAYWLCQFTSPFVVGIVLLGSISVFTASTLVDGALWLVVIGVGLAVPYGFIWWRVKEGKLTDIQVSRRSQRLVPLAVALLALAGVLAGLLWLRASRPLVATLVAVLISFGLATLITQVAKFKISLHVDSAAGAVMVACLLFSPIYVFLSPLVVLVAWARWKLEAHSPFQALCGAALAVVVTATTFWIFGLG